MQLPRRLGALFSIALLSLAAAGPATKPTLPQTGEITFHFIQRSPLSSRKEIARRVCLPQSVLGNDYDLTTYTFRAYVPPNYDPSTPYGVFVYLGNHDVPSVPTHWEPLFDKSHMIFIAPDWHSPMSEFNLIGLGFDAVDNLKRLYNIDTHRLYDMWFNSGSLQMPLAGADVYSGMIVGENWEYFRRINLPANRFYPAGFRPPLPDLLRKAKPHGVVLMVLSGYTDPGPSMLALALKQDGFAHVLTISEKYAEVHYPNYAASWITDPVLPFLDNAAKERPAAPATRPSRTTPSATPGAHQIAAAPATLPSRPSPSSSPGAQHLLTMARLFIANGAPEKARTKLQTILAAYPHDPAAISAQKLLASLPPPPPPPP